jgi:hypothetical protein
MILMNIVKILELNDSTSQEFVFLCFRFDYIFIQDDGTPKAAIGTKKQLGLIPAVTIPGHPVVRSS